MDQPSAAGPRAAPISLDARAQAAALAAELRRNTQGEVLFDAASRGRYSTDASIYQIEPVGVLVPKTEDDVAAALQIAAAHKVPVLPRGGGDRQQQAPARGHRARPRARRGRGAAGHRARCAERTAEEARRVASGRRVDLGTG